MPQLQFAALAGTAQMTSQRQTALLLRYSTHPHRVLRPLSRPHAATECCPPRPKRRDFGSPRPAAADPLPPGQAQSGMPTLIANPGRRGAPVPPRKPSIAMISAPLRAIPLAIAAMLCTAATFTITGFVYCVASFKRIYQLPQILNRINIVMRRRRNRVRALGYHSSFLKRRPRSLAPGRCPPIPGFAPCPILISIAAPASQILFVNAETVRTRPELWCCRRSSRNPRAVRPHRCCNKCRAPLRLVARLSCAL